MGEYIAVLEHNMARALGELYQSRAARKAAKRAILQYWADKPGCDGCWREDEDGEPPPESEYCESCQRHQKLRAEYHAAARRAAAALTRCVRLGEKYGTTYDIEETRS